MKAWNKKLDFKEKNICYKKNINSTETLLLTFILLEIVFWSAVGIFLHPYFFVSYNTASMNYTIFVSLLMNSWKFCFGTKGFQLNYKEINFQSDQRMCFRECNTKSYTWIDNFIQLKRERIGIFWRTLTITSKYFSTVLLNNTHIYKTSVAALLVQDFA